MTVESRKRAMEGKLGGKTFRRFQDLKKFKDDNFKHPDFPEEICRGIAVSTKYSSNIEVKWGNGKCRLYIQNYANKSTFTPMGRTVGYFLIGEHTDIFFSKIFTIFSVKCFTS